MRVKTTTTTGAAITSLSLLAAGTAAQNSSTTSTCASGLHLIVARGSNEPAGAGRIGSVANGVVAAIPGSRITPINYPATFADYPGSVLDGVIAMKLSLTEYNTRCPSSKVALLGFSQGAHVTGDTLCGSVDEDAGEELDLEFNHTAPILSSVVDQSVILFGDPTHTQSATWNQGTSTRDGIFPRDNISACDPYASKIQSWCDTGDIYCDAGNNTAVHGSYFANYTDDAVAFVVSQFNGSTTKLNSTGSGSASPSAVAASGAAATTAPGILMSVASLSVLAAYLL